MSRTRAGDIIFTVAAAVSAIWLASLGAWWLLPLPVVAFAWNAWSATAPRRPGNGK